MITYKHTTHTFCYDLTFSLILLKSIKRYAYFANFVDYNLHEPHNSPCWRNDKHLSTRIGRCFPHVLFL